MSDELKYHSLGMRDGIAVVFATIRREGVHKGLREIAEQYRAAHGENPHVEAFLKSKETTE